jgi:hypothetical protein
VFALIARPHYGLRKDVSNAQVVDTAGVNKGVRGIEWTLDLW